MSDCEQDKVISAAGLNRADSLTAALKITELVQLSRVFNTNLTGALTDATVSAMSWRASAKLASKCMHAEHRLQG